MNDLVDKGVYVFVGVLVAVCACLLVILGMGLQDGLIADHCRDFGRFTINDTVYDCKERTNVE
jgi:hypothetical protein